MEVAPGGAMKNDTDTEHITFDAVLQWRSPPEGR